MDKEGENSNGVRFARGCWGNEARGKHHTRKAMAGMGIGVLGYEMLALPERATGKF